MKDIWRGEEDARSGRWDVMGNTSYQIAHANETAAQTRARQAIADITPRLEMPSWIPALAKWTGVTGLLAGVMAGFLVGRMLGAQFHTGGLILLAAIGGVVGGILGWILPAVLWTLLMMTLGLVVVVILMVVVALVGVSIYATIQYFGH